VEVARTRLLDERDLHPTAQPPSSACRERSSRRPAGRLGPTTSALLRDGVQQRLVRAGDLLDERLDHVVEQLRRGLLRGGWPPAPA
jgi:hypothetical protein